MEQDSSYLVEVAAFRTDTRYRLVHFKGPYDHSEPLGPEEFEPRVKEYFPGIDPHDQDKVHWADRPWEWPHWHPGEA